MEILVGIWICCGIASGMIAEKKSRDATLWFFLGILFGVFALGVIAVLPPA